MYGWHLAAEERSLLVVSSKELFRLPKAYPPANKLTTLSISLGCTEPLLVGGLPDGDFKVKCMSGLGVLQNTNLSNKLYQIVLFYHAYDTTASKQLTVKVEFFCSYTLEKSVMRCTNSYSGSQPIILNLNTFPTLNLFQGKSITNHPDFHNRYYYPWQRRAYLCVLQNKFIFVMGTPFLVTDIICKQRKAW